MVDGMSFYVLTYLARHQSSQTNQLQHEFSSHSFQTARRAVDHLRAKLGNKPHHSPGTSDHLALIGISSYS